MIAHVTVIFNRHITLSDASNVVITGGCITSCGGDGIVSYGSSKATAALLLVRKNASSGISVLSKSFTMLSQCTVSGNVAHGVSAADANFVMKCSCVIGNNMCGCSAVSGSCAQVADSTVSANRSDGMMHDAGNQSSTYTRVTCKNNNKSGLHLTGKSLANAKDSLFTGNVRNGVRVEDGSTIVAERCR